MIDIWFALDSITLKAVTISQTMLHSFPTNSYLLGMGGSLLWDRYPLIYFCFIKGRNTVNLHYNGMSGFYKIVKSCEVMRSKAGHRTIMESFLTTPNSENCTLFVSLKEQSDIFDLLVYRIKIYNYAFGKAGFYDILLK